VHWWVLVHSKLQWGPVPAMKAGLQSPSLGLFQFQIGKKLPASLVWVSTNLFLFDETSG